VNLDFVYCSSYPDVLVVPNEMTDSELFKVKEFRSRGRFPCLTWIHPTNNCVLLRCSQPESGITGKRCIEDEKLLSMAEVKYIFDARPKVNALANSVKGKGFENMQNYDNATLVFLDIENIHEMRRRYIEI
jgi:myotubularin-related protein 1/2